MTRCKLNNADKHASEPSVRDRAMDAAADCFQHQGLNKTSMELVAKRGQMSRATLYRHFANRDELALAVIEREAMRVAMIVYKKIQCFDDIGEFIIEGVICSCNEITGNRILGSVFKPDSISTSSQLILMSRRLTNIGLDVMKPMIEPAQRAGVVRDNLSPEMIMDWIFRMLISILTMPSELISTDDKKRLLLKEMLLPALLNQ